MISLMMRYINTDYKYHLPKFPPHFFRLNFYVFIMKAACVITIFPLMNFLAAPSASAVDFDAAPSKGASSCQHFKQVSENFVTHTFMYVRKLQSWGTFFGLGTFLYLIYWEKDVCRQNSTKKEVKKYVKGTKTSILGRKRPAPCYDFVLGTRKTKKNTPLPQKKAYHTKIP